MSFMILLYTLFINPDPIIVVSPAFEEGGAIPSQFTCDGENINPMLIISGIPEGTQTLALIVEDSEAPPTQTARWLVWNIAPVEVIDENSAPGVSGELASGGNEYEGPCPDGESQRYVFKVFALDSSLHLKPRSMRSELLRAMEGHVLATGELSGIYSRGIVSIKNSKKRKQDNRK